MSEEPKPWDRQLNEPLIWYKRFTRFRLMEPVRSIADVWREEETAKNREKPRENPNGDWYKVAKQWQWEERAVAWDEFLDKDIEKKIAAEKKKVFRAQYALAHKRVEELNKIVTRLIGYLDDEQNVWLPDVKAIGTGPNARQVDLVRFNAPLFGEIRDYLGDIAAEKGERIKKSDVSLNVLPKEYHNTPEDGIDVE